MNLLQFLSCRLKSRFLIETHFSFWSVSASSVLLMAMDPNSFEQEGNSASGDNSLKHKWNSVSAPTRDLHKDTSGFDCNICFDSAQDPVVTLCGHLYCWPCIYKWLHVRTSSLDTDQPERNCPVCKANISSSSLVPLYGRGTSSDSQSKDPHSDLAIPQRPPPFGLNPMTTSSHQSQQQDENLFHSQSQSFHHQQYFPHPYGGYATLASSSLGGIAMTNFFNPMFGMLGEMVYARISGSSNTTMGTRGVIGDKWSMRILWACAIGSAVGLYMVAVERQQQNRDRMMAESLKAMESEGGGDLLPDFRPSDYGLFLCSYRSMLILPSCRTQKLCVPILTESEVDQGCSERDHAASPRRLCTCSCRMPLLLKGSK
ncbi:hypothetical protein V6N11_004729 [Hibiscus sabdariffa]|uniref:E3 ubiquitin-protein ligase RMA n=1 Tax=Hibiscus sabdariffa TaxID=183260 RepID=A0ABR2SH24_9ROSI